MESSWRQAFKIILFVVGVLGGEFILIALQLGLEAATKPSGNLSSYFIVAHLGFTAVFLFLLYRAFNYSEIKEAKTNGLPATAEVFESTPTQWQTRPWRRRTIYPPPGAKPRHYEFKLRLRVSPPEGEPYDVTIFEYFLADKEPTAGMTIPVRIHPKRPGVVVPMIDGQL